MGEGDSIQCKKRFTGMGTARGNTGIREDFAKFKKSNKIPNYMLRNPMYQRLVFVGRNAACLVDNADDATPTTSDDGDKHGAPGRHDGRNRFSFHPRGVSNHSWAGRGGTKES